MNLRVLFAALGLAAAAGLSGCASEPPARPRGDVFADAAFAPPTVAVDARQALAMTPAMQRFADGEMAVEIRRKGLRDGLIDALYTKGRLQLDYDSVSTRNASEAFEARRGNCLSLVLMTAAFARHYNLPVSFNSVITDDIWTRYNGMFIAAGHINITLAAIPAPPGAMVFGSDNLLTIDFLPASQLTGQRSRVVDESTVVAMYLSNRAAEALTTGELDNAYWWARAAIEADPRWLAAYNTLAVVYRRKGLGDRAESVLRFVLEREPANMQALANLSIVLTDAGRVGEAKAAAQRLAEIQPIPPYRYFDQGMVAMQVGDYPLAREYFRKEIARDAYVSEFHYWLALANYGLGDVASARDEISKALESSATLRDRELYGAKLAWLNRQRGH